MTIQFDLDEDARLAELVATDTTEPTPAGGIELAPQQAEAVDKIADWYADDNQQVFRLFGYAGSGKAQRHGSKVYTPNGPVNIEDLAVGDLVFGADGQAVAVTGVFPQGMRDGYEMVFRDGVSVFCDRDHLWNVQTAKMRQIGQPYKTMATGEILDTGVKFDCGIYRFSIPMCEPVQYPTRDLPIDPYVLGALIGDGTNLGGTPTLCISHEDQFIAEEVRRRLPSWAAMRLSFTTCDRYLISDPRHYNTNEIGAAFTQLGLAVKSPQRFIPTDYLYASIEQRWALLRGLMDTDGTARNNRVSFSTKSTQLAIDVIALVQSLGGTAIPQKTGREGEYCVNVKLMTCPFLLPRKAAQWKPSTKNPPSRRIVAIRPAGRALHTCISVDAPDGLYLTDHYAVTHNTTLAKHIVEQLGVRNTLYAAFTGKAAHVLNTKGCEGASTVHSLIYQPVERVRAHLDRLKKQLLECDNPFERATLEMEIKREQAKVDNPDWILREDSTLNDADLLVLDEVSMVGERMARDLLSFDRKILCLGDPAQLPPVDGGGYFINHHPDHLLTEIHRSALDSPVTRLATAIRNSPPGDRGYGVHGSDGDSGRHEHLTISDLLGFDQILVGRNATRWQAVHLLRTLRGLTGTMPQPGDRIIALANSGQAEVFNGQQFEVLTAAPGPTEDRYWVTVRDDEGLERGLMMWAAGFRDLEGEKQAKRDGRGNVIAATWAQAITTHKSQGSQWPRVLVVDESSVFYGAAYREHAKTAGPAYASIEGHINGRRWLYTSVTRASQRVVIVPTLNGVIAP